MLEAKSANYSTHYFTYQDFRKNELQTTSVPSLVVNLFLFFEFMAKVKKHNKPQPFSIPIRNNESFQIRNCMDWTCIKWHQKLERSKYWFLKKNIFIRFHIWHFLCLLRDEFMQYIIWKLYLFGSQRDKPWHRLWILIYIQVLVEIIFFAWNEYLYHLKHSSLYRGEIFCTLNRYPIIQGDLKPWAEHSLPILLNS